MFLRHLRRTRAILHVVDASAADPATDYWAVREELRLYNPEYCKRCAPKGGGMGACGRRCGCRRSAQPGGGGMLHCAARGPQGA
jgi:hypothetical protein